ncbi:hypothetical protein [Actinomadura rudentiformis]|uniref:SH3 domain-containing protein n=1 Tax=Actinomadura rudentiformis TaxID=359158 RepID=A0A6H9YSN2_9ACTN|nr:hypothetical protein [Actinomadura rudentiformis]KAB2349710.1 hypothetical protein F8566_13240 [Actinomadura rudentiformis]
MKRVLSTSAALAAFALAGVGLAGPASAAQVQSAASCPISKVKAKENLKIRVSPTNSTTLGLMLKGAVSCSFDFKAGTTYTACGARDNHYSKITSRGITGWVVDTCLLPA